MLRALRRECAHRRLLEARVAALQEQVLNQHQSPPPSPPPSLGDIDQVSLARRSAGPNSRRDSDQPMPWLTPISERDSISRASQRKSNEERANAYSQARVAASARLAERELKEVQSSFEADRHGRRCPVINPYDRRMRYWEWMVMSFLCYQAIELPLRIAFEASFYSAQGVFVCRWIEFGMDVTFLVDLALNFFVAFVDEDMEVVTDHSLIARKVECIHAHGRQPWHAA